MLTLSDSSIIFILAPANSASGGQEALHQLGYYLLKNGCQCKMAYYQFDKKNQSPVVDKYEKYSVPHCLFENIVDDSEHLIICPEIATALLQQFSNIQKSIWWLSVHFYRVGFRNSSIIKMIPNFLRGRFKKIRRIRSERKNMYTFTDDSVINFTASEYAYSYVKSRGGNPQRLIEPLGIDFLNNFDQAIPTQLSSEGRDLVVLYNPIKRSRLMQRLQKQYPQIPFIPLIGYTPEELITVMKKSVLYVDFGKFPGPERLPKEAVICGCCIITGTRGASAFYEDVRIPDEYKVKNQSTKQVASLISDVLISYDTHIEKFEAYRDMVRDLEENFEKQIQTIFK